MIRKTTVVLLLFTGTAFSGFCELVSNEPIVGVIRWDAWNEWGYFQKFLQPIEWRDRLPFFARVDDSGQVSFREDVPEIIDREIDLASKAGLDFWAFVWYHPDGWEKSRLMMRCMDLYLASGKRNQIRFALILQGGHLGSRSEWEKTTALLSELMSKDTYQRVLGNRPLLFLFSIEDAVKFFESEEACNKALRQLRQAVQKRSQADPYIAGMVFEPEKGLKFLSSLGLDAVSAYSNPPYGFSRKEFPYEHQMQLNYSFWVECKRLGVPLIPTVNTGWDFRPEADPSIPYRNPEADWIAQATPQQIAAHLESAVTWVKTNPEICVANAILIYAWNELNEGGWLLPTLKEGDARLVEIRKVLREEEKGHQADQ